jgi:hypothetical protein
MVKISNFHIARSGFLYHNDMTDAKFPEAKFRGGDAKELAVVA